MEKLQLLQKKREELAAGGGKKRQEAQHGKGKLCARERIEQLVDEGTFVEYFPYMTTRCTDFGMEESRYAGDGVVTGSARIGGRQVWLAAQDFTVLGGSLGEQHAERIARVQDLALATRCPFLFINDSGGARIQEGVYALDGYAKIFRRNILSSGVIPQISLILGPCAGGAAYSPALTDFVFMVEGISQMYITGPDVIKTVTGEEVTHEQLGGAATQATKSGNIHFRCASEQECFTVLRQLLGYLPQHNGQIPPQYRGQTPAGGSTSETLRQVIVQPATKSYDVHDVLREIGDADSFLEVQRDWAQNVVVGFCRLAGRTIGILASQPRYLSGTLDINASDKAARFVRFCDAFNIPILSLVDVPGYLPGTTQEYNGIIRHGAKLLYAIAEATVPKVALVLRKAYGGAYIAMAARSLGYDRVLGLPSAEIAVMGAEGAASIIFRKEIAAAADPEAMRRQKVEELQDTAMNPFVSAAGGMIDTVLAPEEVRDTLIATFTALASKVETHPEKKHANMPL